MDPLMYEELDLEELEWKLYSQVYHSTQEYEESPAVLDSINSDIPSNPENQKKYFRYFDNRNSQSTPPTKGQTYISLDRNRTESLNKDTRTPTIQNDITINSNSTTVHTNCVDPQRFHNNITVNQYTVPVIIHPDGVLPRPEKYFRSWSAETLKLLPPNKRPRKPKNKKKQRAGQSSKKLNPYQNGTLLKPITIWLSDDSDDECVIVDSNTSNTKLTKLKTGFPKKYDESEGGDKPESDDDIIYIPPPPIEVIDIEENGILPDAEPCSSSEFDSNTSKVIEEHTFDSTEKSRTPPHNPAVLETPESVASNDFLESQPAATSSSNFNFSLHGSDFNNHPGDFVRPPSKTVETCETESSCSTNDQSRDFSNTVKTIVFDEIEFPREDIFSEKNLESFSSFITPKRNSKQARESSTGKGVSIFAENTRDDTSSDSSSSESDYEPPEKLRAAKYLKMIEEIKVYPIYHLWCPTRLQKSFFE
ncbi:hypothetical protein JTB14_012076 [Gonioctena quinquepunctata]|nr:hypothetical protein JTB14_012076 [Gonioctena quinquepunctata]